MDKQYIIDKYKNKVAIANGLSTLDQPVMETVESYIDAALDDMLGAGVKESVLLTNALVLTTLIIFVSDNLTMNGGSFVMSSTYERNVAKLRNLPEAIVPPDYKNYVHKSGDTMTGDLDFDGNKIKGLPDPIDGDEPVPYRMFGIFNELDARVNYFSGELRIIIPNDPMVVNNIHKLERVEVQTYRKRKIGSVDLSYTGSDQKSKNTWCTPKQEFGAVGYTPLKSYDYEIINPEEITTVSPIIETFDISETDNFVVISLTEYMNKLASSLLFISDQPRLQSHEIKLRVMNYNLKDFLNPSGDSYPASTININQMDHTGYFYLFGEQSQGSTKNRLRPRRFRFKLVFNDGTVVYTKNELVLQTRSNSTIFSVGNIK